MEILVTYYSNGIDKVVDKLITVDKRGIYMPRKIALAFQPEWAQFANVKIVDSEHVYHFDLRDES